MGTTADLPDSGRCDVGIQLVLLHDQADVLGGTNTNECIQRSSVTCQNAVSMKLTLFKMYSKGLCDL